jgi:sialidase-1
MAEELPDGRLYLIIRNEAHYDGKKAYAWSNDAGETWTPVKLQPQLPDTRCQASIIRWTDPADVSAVAYLYTGITRDDRPIRKTLDSTDPDNKKSSAASPDAPIGRHRLALFASTDQCQTWRELGPVQPGCASYSDLAVLPGGDLLCVYEGGERSAYESIRVARFTSDWLRQRIREPGSTSR